MESEPTGLHQIWWPSPEALDDLTVEDSEEGFSLSAPDNTECAAWLAYYNQTEELREQFNREFLAAITDYVKTLNLTNEDGSPLEDSFRGEDHPVQAEEDAAGTV